MPGMSGVELYSSLRAREDPVPFIFITAFAETVNRSNFEADICVLQKPYQAELLIACIEKAIDV